MTLQEPSRVSLLAGVLAIQRGWTQVKVVWASDSGLNADGSYPYCVGGRKPEWKSGWTPVEYENESKTRRELVGEGVPLEEQDRRADNLLAESKRQYSQ